MHRCIHTFLLLLLLAPATAFAQHGGDPTTSPVSAVYEDRAAWSRDLAALFNEIKSVHPQYDVRYGADDWQASYDALQADIPTLEWQEFVTRTAQFVANIHDGHTSLFPPALQGPGFDKQYPLRAYYFGADVYVTRVAPDAQAIVGGRIISVGGMPAHDVFEALMSTISDGSPMWDVTYAPVALRLPGYAQAFGFADADGGLTVTVETPGGETATATLHPVDSDPEPLLVTVFDLYNPDADYPRWMTEDAPYVYEYLPDQNAVYLIYGEVQSDEDDPIEVFAARMFQFIEENEVERLIIDVRNNGGGDNTYNAPFVHGVIASRLNHPGGVYVLAGRQTFSAAQNFCDWMEKHTQALFVGEPTGGRPNHFGDAEYYTLPETGIAAIISTLRWQDSFDSDPRPWIRPDVPAVLTFEDFLAGRDPALQAALAHDATGIAFEPFTARRWYRDTQFLGWDVPIMGMRGVYDAEGNEVR